MQKITQDISQTLTFILLTANKSLTQNRRDLAKQILLAGHKLLAPFAKLGVLIHWIV